MKHKIYNIEKCIDWNEINRIFQENKDKKIICFGAGTATELVIKNLPDIEISFLLDNNKEFWGKEKDGIEIKSPEVLTKVSKNEYIILILSRHVKQISKQLESYGLERNKNYYDIYTKFLKYFRIEKFDDTAQKFIKLLETIPINKFNSITVKDDKKIGIVCVGSLVKVSVWYAFTQYLLMVYYGYKPTLIVDTLEGYDEYIFFEGFSAVARIYIDYVIDYAKKLGIIFDVRYIEDSKQQFVTENEEKDLYNMSSDNLIWFDSRKDEQFLNNDEQREKISYEILYKNYKHIKGFFEENAFETINVYTGMHKQRVLYKYIADNMGIRMSSYDGERVKTTQYSTGDCPSHIMDAYRLINEKWFNNEEKIKLMEIANDILKRKIEQVDYNGTNIVSYQLAKLSNSTEKYDVVIPLNIEWDAAALGIKNVYSGMYDWVKEVCEFIMENSDATVLVREHPAQNYHNNFNFVNIEERLSSLKKYGERIKILKASVPKNTYDYILNCKLVLPYSSTLGIESVMLGKNIVIHTDCYYSLMTFANKANSKQEYYSNILKALNGELKITEADKCNAGIMFLVILNLNMETQFTDGNNGWLKLKWSEILKCNGIGDIVACIGDGVPVMYNKIKQYLK